MQLSAKSADPPLSPGLHEKLQPRFHRCLLGLEVARTQGTLHQFVVDLDISSHVRFVCIDQRMIHSTSELPQERLVDFLARVSHKFA